MSNVAEDEKFDGLFMSAIQNSQGIDNFFTALFSFMRRKTDFFSQDSQSKLKVQKAMEEQIALYKADKKREDLVKQKQAEAKAKKDAEKRANEAGSGATVEEIDDDEAKKIEELQALQKKQQDAKAKKAEEEKAGEKQDKAQAEKDKEDELKQPPNAGNGGQTDKYLWHQTLEEVNAFITLPENTTAKMLDVKITMQKLRVALKSKPNEPIVDGKWCKKIHAEESFWNIERDGQKSVLQVTMEKYEKQNWWNCLIEGDIEINTQKVEPENSKLSDLDGETRQTVEKMMFDQQQKAKGLPTSEEQEKQNKLKAFMDAHPEMDFSNAKFS